MSTVESEAPAPADTSKNQNQKQGDAEVLPHECKFCHERFKSRNAIFKHLRTNAACFEAACAASGKTPMTGTVKLPKQKVVIRFGYQTSATSSKEDEEVPQKRQLPLAPNEMAAQQVQQAFFAALKKHHPIQEEETSGNTDDRMTQTSAARHRHSCLTQDEDCSASSDYIGVYYRGEPLDDFGPVMKDMQQRLDEFTTGSSALENISVLDARVIPVKANFAAEKSCTQRVYHYLLPLDWLEGGHEAQTWWLEQGGQEQFHAMRAGQFEHRPRTTQHRPEVLKRLKLALSSLESENLVKQGVKKGGNHPKKKKDRTNKTKSQGDSDASGAAPLKRPKLESSEDNERNENVDDAISNADVVDPDTTDKNDMNNDQKVKSSNLKTKPKKEATVVAGASPGRFGNLWVKERKCWHNFADPALRGMASPSNDPVWRAVDRAKVLKIWGDDNKDNGETMMAVVEIRGDGYVTQQIRRMMGAVIAMTNGWLPLDYADMATRSDVCLETPLAPPGRMYFAGGRFHFLELTLPRPLKSLFKEREPVPEAWQEKLQSSMVQTARSDVVQREEQAWLNNLQHVEAPRIQAQFAQIVKDDKLRKERAAALTPKLSTTLSPDHVFTEAPGSYQKTVGLLRSVVSEEKWPRTSKARSRVIRSVDQSESDAADYTKQLGAATFDGEKFQCGSFTVLNEDLVDGKLPLGNKLFPELARAVFELEAELAKVSPAAANGAHVPDGVRRVSTHCAVNRNAEFVPHVDSGRGAGQSVSMITGLGDYEGGEIYVEGQAYDIRYEALEFDGWKQRHWTAPFEGERYSLVWFTPAGNETNVKVENDYVQDAASNEEDRKAQQFVLEHQRRLPSFPLLEYRPDSTDALVISEMFDPEKGCTYELKNQIWEGNDLPEDFVLAGHESILDIGAHIGAFSRFALAAGCTKVIAYEPEPSNIEFLSTNLRPSNESSGDITIHAAAVAHGAPGNAQLVHARTRGDGSKNTWRHALEDYSQYIDKSVKMSCSKQEGILMRTEVATVPFFGGALFPGVTFVKLDCEGAELDILLSAEAKEAKSWLDVTHLVFEWSFTKEKRLIKFRQVISGLKEAGFQVVYDGQGAWWDTDDIKTMWPFHNDLVVYAKRGTPSPGEK